MTTKASTCLVGYTDIAERGIDEHSVLLQRVTQGEPEAFWALWKHFGPVLRHRCLKWMGGNHADAEDALSGASLRAWQYLSAHASEIAHIKPWLFRLVYNHCMSMHKMHQVHLRHLQPMRDRYCLHMTPSEGSGTSFEEAMLRKEMVMVLRNRINALPSRLREPAVLYFFHDMLHRDIAAHLRLTPENVRKRLQHARTILRTQLSQYFHRDHGVRWENGKDETALTTPDLLLGACYRVIGDEDHSQSWWRKAVQCSRHLIPVYPAMGHYWLGEALAVCGQWKNACQAYRVALQHHVLYPARHEIETVLRCKTPTENAQPEEEKA